MSVDICNTKAKYYPGHDTVITNGDVILFTNQSINATTYEWYINDQLLSSGTDLSYHPAIGVNKIMLIASFGICRDTAYSYVIWDGIFPGQYGNLQKQYNPPGKAMEPFCMASDQSNGYLLAGNYYIPSDNTLMIRTTALVHIDERGCVDWARSLKEQEPQVIQAVVSTSDSGYLISAFPFQSQQDNYPKELHVFKLDKSGNKQWAHSFSNGTHVNNYYSAICETKDKGFVLEVGSFSQGGNTSSLSLFKIDASGIFVWGRSLGVEENAFYNIGGVLEKGNRIYASGSIYQGSTPYDLLRSFLIQLDETTGQVIWTMKNDPVNLPLTFTDIHEYKDSLLINSYSPARLNNFIFLNYNGNMGNSIQVNNPYGSLNGKGNILVSADNGIYFHQSSGISGLSHKDIIMRLDPDKQIAWQYDFSPSVLNLSGWNQLSSVSGNAVSGIGTSQLSNGYKSMTFLKLDAEGNGCNSGLSALQVVPGQVSMVPMDWTMNSSLPLVVNDFPLNLTDMSVESRLVCPKLISGCDLLKLEGPTRVCSPGDTITIKLHCDPFCSDRATWTYDQESVKWISDSGFTKKVLFSKPGVFTIRVAKNGCNTLTDSVVVSVGDRVLKTNLPRDTSLCLGYSIQLYADSGYEQYLWQDGSDRAGIHVAVSGLYWVKLTDADGCNYTDTVHVGPPKPNPSLFLPNDTVICAGEILDLKPFQTFKAYTWSTGDTGNTLKLKLPGIYNLQVVDQFGCTGSDTIVIKTRICPTGLFFANAFTPNKDGVNDVFKPSWFIRPQEYQLKIYNRWGQPVFESKDPGVGWDGRIGNKDQESGVYVWFCTYQFEGNKKNVVQGTVLLLR